MNLLDQSKIFSNISLNRQFEQSPKNEYDRKVSLVKEKSPKFENDRKNQLKNLETPSDILSAKYEPVV